MKKEDVILELNEKLHIIPGDLNTVFMERNASGQTEQSLVNFIRNLNLTFFIFIFNSVFLFYNHYLYSYLKNT